MRALSRAIRTPPDVAGVPRVSSMAGLERQALGPFDVLAQSLSAVAPTAAAATMPALVAGQAGVAALPCTLLAWLLVSGVGYAVRQFTLRMRAPGSLYTFVTKGLGPHAGFAAAMGLVAGYGFVAMFGLAGAAMYARNLFDGLLGAATGRAGTCAVLVALGLLCYLVLRRGIRLSARITLVVELVAVAVMLALLAVVLARAGVPRFASPHSSPFTSPHSSPFTSPHSSSFVSLSVSLFVSPSGDGSPGAGAVAAGTALAMTAFVGFESAASLGSETRRPFRNIPRTIRWTLLAVGCTYTVSVFTQQAGARAFGLPLADNELVTTQLAAYSGVPWLGRLLELGQATSMTACAIASLTALSRIVFTLGREGVLPRVLGRADPLRGTPRRALIVVLPLAAGVPLVLTAFGWSPWHAMTHLVLASAAGYLTSYVLVCAAAPVFLRRIGESTRWTAGVCGGVAALLAAVVVVYLVVVARERTSALWLVLGTAVAAAAGYGCLRALRRTTFSGMGLFDETTAADLLGAEPPRTAGAIRDAA